MSKTKDKIADLIDILREEGADIDEWIWMQGFGSWREKDERYMNNFYTLIESKYLEPNYELDDNSYFEEFLGIN